MKSISVKLWMQMLFLIGITLGLLWLFQVVFLEQYYMYSQTRNIKQQGMKIAKLFEEDADEYLIEEVAEDFNLKYNAGVEIYDLQGRRIFGHINMPMMMGRTLDKQKAFAEALKGEIAIRQTKHNRLNSYILLLSIPIGRPESIMGVLIINAPLAAIKETQSIIKEQLMAVTVILILISLILTYCFSRAFTRPILKINEAAAKMADGNLSISLDVSSKDELGMLSATINNLSEQLQKIEQLRRDIIANVSHEFRTPLSLIKGYAETIKDVTGDIPEKRNKQLGIILEEADRLRSMVDDTLNLSKMQSEYFNLDSRPFDIATVVRNIRNRFSYISEENGITLAAENEEHSIVVVGDEARIEQVLYNLVNNACNYTAAGGWVRIKILEAADNVKIEVVDNGKGIDAEELPYIWDRFYKVSRESKGTGLGLSIAKKILEMHLSTFGVESEPGRGSKFWFTLNKA